MIAASVVIGFASNALRPDGIPVIRKPLRETRAFVPKGQLVKSHPPVKKQAKQIRPTVSGKSMLIPLKPTSAKPIRIPTGRESKPKLVLFTPKKETPKPKKRPTMKPQALFTTIPDAKAAFDSGDAQFIDSRPIEDFREEHIQGAISLDVTRIDELAAQTLKSIPKQKLIVTYCSDPECREATKLADALTAIGYTRVVILLEGLPGWKNAGYPVTSKGNSE